MTNTGPAQDKSWRDALKVHPAAELFPLIEGEGFAELVADIKANGLIDPIVLYDGMILDGRNRYRACLAAGVTPYFRVAVQSPETANIARPLITDPVAYVISANIQRRHLTDEQKRELIAKLIEAQPQKSDRQIAKQVKRDHKTVGAVRTKMEDVGRIPHVEKRTDTKGRKQPSKKKRRDVDDFLADKRAAENAAASFGDQFWNFIFDGRHNEPEPENPIVRAWDKATIAQRKEFARAFATDLLRLQQCDGMAGERIRAAEEQRAAEAKTEEHDPMEPPAFLRRTK
jgi:ParB-like chromosome segregation protein Spo0J